MWNQSDDDSPGPLSDRPRDDRVTANGEHGSGHPLHTGVDLLCARLAKSIGLDGAAVAILTGTRGVRELVYATDRTARQLDELQFTVGEGPCLDAFVLNWPQLWSHLDTTMSVDALWPGFAVAAVAAGARAVFAFPIPGHTGPIGVLEVYRHTAGTLPPLDVERAIECAVAVGDVLLGNWRSYRSAAASDRVEDDAPAEPFALSAVHIAAGITAVQLGITPDEGLDRLRAHAYAEQRSISTVAGDIIKRRLSLPN
jgi:hypothetical protein